jgi:adenylylsulfate kinase
MLQKRFHKMNNNLVWHNATVTCEHRASLNYHRGGVIWFAGLSGWGKSTLAHTLDEKLRQYHCHTFVFDGDKVRHGLCSDLELSEQDREENICRIGEITKLFVETGTIANTAFILFNRAERKKYVNW